MHNEENLMIMRIFGKIINFIKNILCTDVMQIYLFNGVIILHNKKSQNMALLKDTTLNVVL